MTPDLTAELTALPRVVTTEVRGTTLSGRDFRFLMQGVRQWYRCAAGVVETDGRPLDGEPGCLGLLLGGPGVGKTLLLEGLRQACESIGFRYSSVACSEGVGPLGSVLRLFRSLAANVSPENCVESLERCSPAVLRLLLDYVPELFEGNDSEWEIADDLPCLPPAYHRSRTIDLFAQGLTAFATDEPLILSIDDIAQLDKMSREVLASCLQMTRRRSRQGGPLLLVVAACRPEDLGSCEWLKKFITPEFESFHVDLRGYSRDDLLDVYESFGVTDATVAERESLFQASSGNPTSVRWILQRFRAGELARSALTQKKINGNIDELVFDAYQSLEPLERDIVECLSCSRTSLGVKEMIVEGDGIARGTLASGPDQKPPARSSDFDILDTCSRLETDGWIVLSCQGAREREWRVAVNVPVEPGRRHDILRRLGSRFVDSDDGVLRSVEAFTYLRESGAADSVTVAGCKAIRIAESLGAYPEALEIRQAVLERLDESDAERWSEMARVTAQRLSEWGDVREAVTVFEDLLERADSLIDTSTRAAVTAEIGALRGTLGDLEREDRMYREALTILTDRDLAPDLPLLLARRARFLAETGTTGVARNELKEVCRLIDDGDVGSNGQTCAGRPVLVEVERYLAEAAYLAGDDPEAIRRRECQGLRAAAVGDVFGQMEAAERLGQLHLLQGQVDLALEYFLDALKLAKESGARIFEPGLQKQVADVLLSRGHTRRAYKVVSTVRDLCLDLNRVDDTRSLNGTLSYLSFVHEELEEGLQALEEYASFVDETGSEESSSFALPPQIESKAERDRELVRLRKVLKKSDGALRERALLSLGDCLVDSGNLDEAGRLYQQSMRGHGAFRNPIDMALVLQRLGRWYRLRGDHVQALKFYEKSLERLGPIPEKGVVGLAYIEVGDILRTQGDLSRGWEFLLSGFRRFQELEDHRGETFALLAIARFLRDVGAHDWSSRVCACVVQLAQRCSDRRGGGEATLLQAVLHSEAGDFVKSDRSFSMAKAIFDESGLLRERTTLDLELGWHSLRQKEFTQAQERARECLERARQLRSQDLLDDALHLLGVVESVFENRGSNIIRAMSALQQALDGVREKQRTLMVRWMLASLGRLYGDLGKEGVSRHYYHEELALSDRLKDRVPTVFWGTFKKEAIRRVFRNETGPHKRASRMHLEAVD